LNVSATPSSRLLPALWWALPLAALALAGVLANAQLNRDLFLYVNAAPLQLPAGGWAAITVLGDALLLLSLGLVFTSREPAAAWALLFAALLATLVSHGIKDLFDVARPVSELGRDAVVVIGPALKHGALPSGHTTAAFTFAAVAGLVRPRWLWWLLPLALLVGLSRVVVGAHWPQDVAAGMALGWLCGGAGLRWVPARLLAWRWNQHALAVFYLGCVLYLPFLDTRYPARWLQWLVAVGCLAAGLVNLFRHLRAGRTPANSSA